MTCAPDPRRYNFTVHLVDDRAIAICMIRILINVINMISIFYLRDTRDGVNVISENFRESRMAADREYKLRNTIATLGKIDVTSSSGGTLAAMSAHFLFYRYWDLTRAIGKILDVGGETFDDRLGVGSL